MQRLQLKITGRYHERFGDTHRFRVRGNGIMFEQIVHNHEMSEEKIAAVNESFKNSLRYIKHYGGYPDESATEKDMIAALNKLSSTEYGLGIKIKDDPLKEFLPFTF